MSRAAALRRGGLGFLGVLLAFPLSAWSDDLQLDVLLKSISHTGPSSTPFIEAHFSKLLARPLIVGGKLEYLGPDELARSIETPYKERTLVRGDQVTVEREGSKTRQFSLQRAPDLKSLLSSFGALLSGNQSGLSQQFEPQLTGSVKDWALTLTPRDAHIAARIHSITVRGNGSEPRCITTLEPNDNVTIMLLGAATETEVSDQIQRSSLETLCQQAALR